MMCVRRFRWIMRMEMQGFVFQPHLTRVLRKIAKKYVMKVSNAPAQHLFSSGMVFINPAVASLPQHHHLIGMHGCHYEYGANGPFEGDGSLESRMEWPCPGIDALPEEYLPVHREPSEWDILEVDVASHLGDQKKLKFNMSKTNRQTRK
eukprot:m.252433 g.252433  ORF g.252433 m.252433 type:complete len:149 (-) comp19565_c0_seq7:112-558(-)